MIESQPLVKNVIRIFFKSLVTLIIISSFGDVFASEYPKSSVEEFREENGSIIGGEGIVFRWGKEKNLKDGSGNDKKLSSEFRNTRNALIWKSSLDFVWDMPILYIDHNNFLIVTDWYISKTNNRVYEQLKINVSDGIENILVKTYLKHKASGVISESKKISNQYKSDILSKYKLLKK